MYIFNFIDLYPYFLLLIIIIILSLCKIKNIDNKFVIFILLFAFSAMRYNVGWDYSHYLEIIKAGHAHVEYNRFELMNRIVFDLAHNTRLFQLAFVFYSFFTLYLVYFICSKKSINPELSLLIYTTFPIFFFASLSTIRQSLAYSMVFMAYGVLVEKKVFKFYLLICLACLIHYSALIGLLLFLLVRFKITFKFNVILLLLSFLISDEVRNIILKINLDISIIGTLKAYITRFSTQSYTTLQYLIYLINFLNLVFYSKLVRLNDSNREIIGIINFGVVVYNILSFNGVLSNRFSTFFLQFIILLIPYYEYVFKQSGRFFVRINIYIFFTGIYFAYLYVYIRAYNLKLLHKISFIPYQYFWEMK